MSVPSARNMGWLFTPGELGFLLDLLGLRPMLPPLPEGTSEDAARLEADDLLRAASLPDGVDIAWQVEEFLGRFLSVMGKARHSLTLYQGDAWVCVRVAVPLLGVWFCPKVGPIRVMPADSVGHARAGVEASMAAHVGEIWMTLGPSGSTERVACEKLPDFIQRWLSSLLDGRTGADR